MEFAVSAFSAKPHDTRQVKFTDAVVWTSTSIFIVPADEGSWKVASLLSFLVSVQCCWENLVKLIKLGREIKKFYLKFSSLPPTTFVSDDNEIAKVSNFRYKLFSYVFLKISPKYCCFDSQKHTQVFLFKFKLVFTVLWLTNSNSRFLRTGKIMLFANHKSITNFSLNFSTFFYSRLCFSI